MRCPCLFLFKLLKALQPFFLKLTFRLVVGEYTVEIECDFEGGVAVLRIIFDRIRQHETARESSLNGFFYIFGVG